MKKIFLSLLLACAALPIAAQEPASPAASTVAEPPFENTLVLSDNAAYRLYPTQNISTFIKLDTRDGRMWLVQYSIESDEYRFEVPLNREQLASGNDQMAGRFELYPTTNRWTFIKLDTRDGRTWQVQWSQEPEHQMIVPINFHAD